ncbi:MAG: PIG-L deacetylase family protein [Pseudolabrys sp.]
MSAVAPALAFQPQQGGRVVLLPHFKPHCDGLQTIGGRIIALGADDCALAAHCVQERAWTDIAGAPADRLVAAGYLARLPSATAALAGPRALVLSPHIDDAALSLGGWIATRRGRVPPPLVLNVFSRQSYQSGLRAPAARLDEIARAEDRLAGRILGYERRALGLAGAQDRLGLALREVMGWRASDVAARFRREIEMLAEAITTAVAAEPIDRLFAPAAIGGHLDHVLVALAAPRIAAELGVPQSGVSLYEDLPYAAGHMGGGIGAEGRVMRAEHFTAIEDKRAALSVFRTRLRAPQVALCLAHARRIAGGHGAAERMFVCPTPQERRAGHAAVSLS